MVCLVVKIAVTGRQLDVVKSGMVVKIAVTGRQLDVMSMDV